MVNNFDHFTTSISLIILAVLKNNNKKISKEIENWHLLLHGSYIIS